MTAAAQLQTDSYLVYPAKQQRDIFEMSRRHPDSSGAGGAIFCSTFSASRASVLSMEADTVVPLGRLNSASTAACFDLSVV